MIILYLISFLTKMIQSFLKKKIRKLEEHLKKMTLNSDLQFIHKEYSNSMTTSKLQSAELLAHWRDSLKQTWDFPFFTEIHIFQSQLGHY